MKASSRCGVDAARMPGLLGRVRADVFFLFFEEERTTACKACRGHARCGRRGRLLQVVCGAGWGVMCNCEVVCGHGVGVAKEKRVPRACRLRPPVPPRPPPAASVGDPLCVFVRHTARRRLWGVGAACEEAAGRRASPVRRYTTGGGPPPAQRRMCVRAFAGLRGCGAPHGATGVCGRGVTSGLTTVFQSQADGAVQGARGMRLDEARVRREVRLPSAARVRKKMPERRLHMGPPEPRVFRASGGSW